MELVKDFFTGFSFFWILVSAITGAVIVMSTSYFYLIANKQVLIYILYGLGVIALFAFGTTICVLTGNVIRK